MPIIRGRGRPRKDGTPNAATQRKLEDAGYTPDSVEDTPTEGNPAEDDTPIEFTPTPIPNPFLWLKTGAQKLGDKEVEILRPFLIEAIRGYSDLADKVISETNRKKTQAVIWSDLDEQEIATLADGLLIIGKRQAHVAVAIREVARTWAAVNAGIILVPRFIKTFRFYTENGGIALW